MLEVEHDQVLTNCIDSRDLDADARQRLLPTIICTYGEPEWGPYPLFMISHSHDDRWREVMIVDTEREFCTFRCTTKDVEYKMGIFADRLEGNWRLDNAMQDALPGSLREFLRMLEEISN